MAKQTEQNGKNGTCRPGSGCKPGSSAPGSAKGYQNNEEYNTAKDGKNCR